MDLLEGEKVKVIQNRQLSSIGADAIHTYYIRMRRICIFEQNCGLIERSSAIITTVMRFKDRIGRNNTDGTVTSQTLAHITIVLDEIQLKMC